MPSFKSPDFKDRQLAGAAAKKALLKKFKAAANDPKASEKSVARQNLIEARNTRALIRSKAKSEREAEKAREDARAAEAGKLSEEQKREEIARGIAEAADRATALLGEQKTARDVRYAARKAAKKDRRRSR